MDKQYVCPTCQISFSRLDNMKRHMSRVHPSDSNDKYQCQWCQKRFSRSDSMKRHIEHIHAGSDPQQIFKTLLTKIDQLEEKDKQHALEQEQLTQKLDQLEEKGKQHSLKIDQLNNKPTNQILNVMCISGHDNYLDMLTDRFGNFNRAIEYIKDCALSDLAGDCKLIEQIYKNSGQPMSFSTNSKKSKFFYQDENRIVVCEDRQSFGRKLANNLQNSYLKGINHLIDQNFERKIDPNKFLDQYDLMAWNAHIYHLSDINYQRKIINQLDVPLKGK